MSGNFVNVLKIIDTLANSWPFTVLLVGSFALILFKKPLIGLIERAHEVGMGGVKVSTKVQEQRQLESSTPSLREDKLIKAVQSPLLSEMEEQIRKDLDVYSKDGIEREKVLIKAVAANQIAVVFERTYSLIFGSQLAILQFLASSPNILERPEAILPFYEKAKAGYPSLYETYSFDKWLSFMKSSILVTQQNESIGITVRGKEFLKYLIDHGYSFFKSG